LNVKKEWIREKIVRQVVSNISLSLSHTNSTLPNQENLETVVWLLRHQWEATGREEEEKGPLRGKEG